MIHGDGEWSSYIGGAVAHGDGAWTAVTYSGSHQIVDHGGLEGQCPTYSFHD